MNEKSIFLKNRGNFRKKRSEKGGKWGQNFCTPVLWANDINMNPLKQ